MRWKDKIGRKIGLIVASLAMLISAVPFRVTANDGQSRVEAFISMFSGEEKTKDDLKADKLTEKDSEFFGVYLSNWYVPFYTQVGNSVAGDESKDGEEEEKKNDDNTEGGSQTVSQLVNAVTNDSSFSEENAKTLVASVMGNIRGKSTTMDVWIGTEQYGDEENRIKIDSFDECNISVFMSAMTGGLDKLVTEMMLKEASIKQSKELAKTTVSDYEGLSNKNDANLSKVKDQTYKYMFFVPHGSTNANKPCFDASLVDGTMTLSQQIFWQCFLETVNVPEVYGNSAFAVLDIMESDLPEEAQKEGSPADKMNKYFQLKPEQALKYSLDNTKMAVSPFGDIIVAGANHQYIGIPACVNPYRWVNVYSKQDEKAIGGDSVPILSGTMLARWTKEGIFDITKSKLGGKGDVKTQGARRLDGKLTVSSGNTTNEETNSGGGSHTTVSAMSGALPTLDLTGTEQTLSDTKEKYTKGLAEYVASGVDNEVVSKAHVRQTAVAELPNGTVDKWQSVSSYDSLKNPSRNNAQDKAWDKKTIQCILEIGANSQDGLGIDTGNIDINYDNGTWQLVNASSKHLLNVKIDNIRQAFENNASWRTSASKSALSAYDTLSKSAGFLKGTRFEEFVGDKESFYKKLDTDLRGMRQTLSEDVVFGDDLADYEDVIKNNLNNQPSNTDTTEEKPKTEESSSSTNSTSEYSYTGMKFGTLETTLKSGGFYNKKIITASTKDYIFFPVYHGVSDTQSDQHGVDTWTRTWFGKGKFNDFAEARTANWAKNNKGKDFAVYSPNGLGSSEGVGAYSTGSSDNDLGVDEDTASTYNLLTNYVALDILGVGGEKSVDTFQITNFLDVDNPDRNKTVFEKNSSLFDSDIAKESVIESYRFTKSDSGYIYVTYLLAGVGERDEDLGFRFTEGTFPELDTKLLDFSGVDGEDTDDRAESILDFAYWMFHPTEGIDYIRIWASNKINGILVGWHDAMVGTTGTGSMTGTTRYKGFTGLTTCPTLQDTAFTAKMAEIYTGSFWIVIILCLVTLFLGWVSNQISATQATLMLMVCCIFVALPSHLINWTVSVTNVVSSQIYDNKFIYWALMQHQMYNTEIDQAAQDAVQSYDTYLRDLYKLNADATQTQGSNSITVRWQAVKKLRSVEYSESDKETLNSDKMSQYGVADDLLDGMLNNSFSGQSFSETTNTYLYRNYIDIANNSRFIYKRISTEGTKFSDKINTEGWTNGTLAGNINNVSTAGQYTNEPATKVDGDPYLYVTAPMASTIVSKGIQTKTLIGTNALDSLDSRVGISNDAFAFSQKSFNTGADIAQTIQSTVTGAGQTADPNFNSADYDNDEYYALASYSLMSESPYYYFSWYLYGQGLSCEAVGGQGYKKLLIGEDNQGFFTYTKEDGTTTDYLKDFMDMEHLYKYVIPYMRMGNEVVGAWAEANGGIFTYDNIPMEEGHENDLNLSDPNNAEIAQKYWHNVNVRRLYNLYCPWVDQIDNATYSKPQTISAVGKSFTIENPSDPYSYPAERPMVFSRAEAESYGYTDGQLTDVELRIIKFEETARKSMFELLNYSGFDDSVLNAAASMECLFAYNQAFSDTHIMGDRTEMYPTNFEVKDFSYDAYLRFILSNNSADTVAKDGQSSADTTALESMQQASYGNTLAEKGFYQRIVSKGSFLTSILLIVNDILAQVILPLIKYIFIVAIFLMLIVEVLVLVFKAAKGEKPYKRYWKLALLPLLKFCVTLVGLSLVIGMMMGNTTASLTGGDLVSMQFGSPDLALCAMIIAFGFVDYYLIKIMVDLIRNLWRDTKKVWGAMTGMVSGGVKAVMNRITGADNKGGIGGMVSDAGQAVVEAHGERSDRKWRDDPDETPQGYTGENQNIDGNAEDEAEAEEHADDINAKIAEGKEDA